MFFEAECVLAGRGGLSFYVKGNGQLKKKKKTPGMPILLQHRNQMLCIVKRKLIIFSQDEQTNLMPEGDIEANTGCTR